MGSRWAGAAARAPIAVRFPVCPHRPGLSWCPAGHPGREAGQWRPAEPTGLGLALVEQIPASEQDCGADESPRIAVGVDEGPADEQQDDDPEDHLHLGLVIRGGVAGGGHEQPARYVHDGAGAAENRCHHENYAYQERIYVVAVADSRGNTGELAVSGQPQRASPPHV